MRSVWYGGSGLRRRLRRSDAHSVDKGPRWPDCHRWAARLASKTYPRRRSAGQPGRGSALSVIPCALRARAGAAYRTAGHPPMGRSHDLGDDRWPRIRGIVEVGLTEHGGSWRWSTFRRPSRSTSVFSKSRRRPARRVNGSCQLASLWNGSTRRSRAKPCRFGAEGHASELTIASETRGTPADGARKERGVPGPVLFARYAFPPQLPLYCGPATMTRFFLRAAGADDRDLCERCRSVRRGLALPRSTRPRPAGCPLDFPGVEAYWVWQPRAKPGEYAAWAIRWRAVPPNAGGSSRAPRGPRRRRTAHSFAVFASIP